jgi:uncharacterized protein (DUF2164 family)
LENIFCAALALHIANKPVNRETIQSVLNAAGTPADEAALDAVAAFVESLETARQQNEKTVDPRIIKFLTSELAHHKVQAEKLEAIIEELTEHFYSTSVSDEQRLSEQKIPPAIEEILEILEKTQQKADIEHPQPTDNACPEVSTGTNEDTGRYLYGVSARGTVLNLGHIGIDGNEVYTIPFSEICAIVHNCSAEPYQSSDDEVVKSWVRTHQKVLDEAKQQFGNVIPFSFDTILHPKDEVTPADKIVTDWLKENYEQLRLLLGEIEGRDEYGVQVYYEPGVIGKQVSEQSDEIRKIKEEISGKSPGMAYLSQQRLEKVVKAEMESFADRWFNDFYHRIKQHTDDILVEKVKKTDKDRVMLLNLSCLMTREKANDLGTELEEINNMEGFSVHFSGPWPPYSFVAKPAKLAAKEG